MNFLEELQWRGMLHDATPGIEEVINAGPVTGYIGFDPTAPSMTIGNYVQIMLLTIFQRSGHNPIALMGGATGRIGDPSGKDKERELKSEEELDANLQRQILQVKKFLNFDDGPNKAVIVNNLDFYRNMGILEFLRVVGKTLTVNYMIGKESVQKRLETGISFTEFSYQLLQAYDFQCLYNQHKCILQMGGSDQWGNITSGTEFIRRNLGEKAYAATTPLLTKADGTKFGKSEQGNIWLDPDMTSPYRFYQFWVNAADADLQKFMRYFTLRSQKEVETMENDLAGDPNALKRALAEELTIRVHSEADCRAVEQVSNLLFNQRAGKDDLSALTPQVLAAVAREIPDFKVPREVLAAGVNIVDLLADHTAICASKGDARRAIQNMAVSVNKEKITSHEASVNHEALLHGRYLMVENGKKNKFMVEIG
ncbi:MAG TPA: tyrosine--tRNA ligase [Flavilitoribacter sp.]|nr:tyrosine--tRNA ligase [Flavilitoribacter sp.]